MELEDPRTSVRGQLKRYDMSTTRSEKATAQGAQGNGSYIVLAHTAFSAFAIPMNIG